MNDKMKYYDMLRAVPEEAQKTIQGGRLKGFTDINPMWRIKMLTSVFGPCGLGWYIEEVDRWTEASGEQRAAFVKIHLFFRQGDEWSRPIVGIGGSSLVSMEKSGAYLSDEAYKMAYTDAISVACKALGMGADVYFEKDRTKYNMPPSQVIGPGQGDVPKASQTQGKPVMSDNQLKRIIARINAGELDIMNKCMSQFELKDYQVHAINDAIGQYKVNNNIK